MGEVEVEEFGVEVAAALGGVPGEGGLVDASAGAAEVVVEVAPFLVGREPEEEGGVAGALGVVGRLGAGDELAVGSFALLDGGLGLGQIDGGGEQVGEGGGGV